VKVWIYKGEIFDLYKQQETETTKAASAN
jgi:ribosomal protein S3